MALSERSQEIHRAFCTYVKTRDEKVIEKFPLKDIQFTLMESNDMGFPHYKAMEMRAAELKDIKAMERKRNREVESVKPKFRYKENICWPQIEEEYGLTKRIFGRRINFVGNSFKRKIIFRDTEQAYIFSKHGFNKPALILAAAVIEELLRLYLESKNVKPENNKFVCYIECCEKNNFFKKAIRHQATVARLFRNTVHLDNENYKKDSISTANSKEAVASLFALINDF